MKFFSVAALILQLLPVADTFAQNGLQEKLKLLEIRDTGLISEIQENLQRGPQFRNRLDFSDLPIDVRLDSLFAFVAFQKSVGQTAFDTSVKPYLDEKQRQWSRNPIAFSDDEEMIYESFVKTLSWQNAIESAQLFEDFIAVNYKDPEQTRSILTVLMYVKNSYRYTTQAGKNGIEDFVVKKLYEEFQSYTAVDWRVFSMHPGAMLLWLAATWAWEYKQEN